MSGDVRVALPLACLAAGAVIVYLVARLITSRNHWLAVLTALAFAAALSALLPLAQNTRAALVTGGDVLAWGDFTPGGVVLRADAGALFIVSIALGLGLCVTIYSGRYLALDRRYKTYYPLLMLMITGLMGMVMTSDLFSLYLFCELMSVTAYVLVAFRRHTDTAVEAGFKYLMMGSVGTVTLLMGIALIYRETGSLAIDQPTAVPGVWVRAGLACVWVGLAIKSAIVPVHTWLPDAHGRAPSSVSALLSGIVIQSAFYVLLKVSLGLGFPAQTLGLGLMICALLNMVIGNGMALVQTHTKRLLAYSTIAQMGYGMFSVGVGLRYGVPEAVQAGFFLLLAHAAMKGLAFLSKGVCHFYCHTTTVEELRGTFQQIPLVAITFTVALVGLIGIPPLAGFAGKWFILAEALRVGDALAYVGVAIFLLMTLLSLGYYLPLIGMLFAPLSANENSTPIVISYWMIVPLVLLTALVIAIGVYPEPWWQWAAGVLR